MQQNIKPRYDGRWRPEAGKVLPNPPADIQPVIRFKNPQTGNVVWHDLVKGEISIANQELDDLVIARADGTPTYNFCVVVDDWEMGITQVIRGDDHVNNTPRQINMLNALGATVPQYAHLSMILGDDGQKLSKRHGAVSVMQYDEDGYLPEAVLNYLARLGWSHGDDEIFDMPQFCEWFDLDHITPSAAQFNTEKLKWLNAHYIKQAAPEMLAKDIKQRLGKLNISIDGGPSLNAVLDLYKERANTLNDLANSIAYFYQKPTLDAASVVKHLTAEIKPVLNGLLDAFKSIDWQADHIHHVIEAAVTQNQLKFPKVAMPLRVALTGIAQSPSIDQVMALLGQDETLIRLAAAIQSI
jgi:glutamyl-tRNA synthetase